MTTRVLLMGTEACGKTVLLAVLAQKYRSFTDDGYFLEAMNAEANAFTNRNWELLTSMGEWPPATPPGALHGFVWHVHHRAPRTVEDTAPVLETVVDLNMADFAGEVFRKTFGKGDISSEEAKQLMSFVDQTDGVVCLVNLREIIDEQEVERKSETEWAIKNLLDHAAKRMGIPALLVFTQTDRYVAIIDGLSPREVLQRYLPQVAGAHPNIPVLFVSAIDKTVPTPSADGLVIEKPAKEFRSHGISELMEWVSLVRARPMPPPVPQNAQRPEVKVLWQQFAKQTALVIGALLILIIWWLWPTPLVPVEISSGANPWAGKWVKVINTSKSKLQLTISGCGDRPVALPVNHFYILGGRDDSCTLWPGNVVVVAADGYAPRSFTVP